MAADDEGEDAVTVSGELTQGLTMLRLNAESRMLVFEVKLVVVHQTFRAPLFVLASAAWHEAVTVSIIVSTERLSTEMVYRFELPRLPFSSKRTIDFPILHKHKNVQLGDQIQHKNSHINK